MLTHARWGTLSPNLANTVAPRIFKAFLTRPSSVGFRGRSVGINRYGASAPGEDLLQELGINPENVANEALDLLGRSEWMDEEPGTPAVEPTDPSEGHS